MRLITWNCNGALRRKFQALDSIDADILVIQECEDPTRSCDAYQTWAGNHIWSGYGKNKGIGVFVRSGHSIERLEWNDNGSQLFVPVKVNGSLEILAVWTQQAAPSSEGYIGQFWKYLQHHKSRLSSDAIVCGDFNSNSIWDKPRRRWNHSECVSELEEIGFDSLYHRATGELQGKESRATFFLYRHLARPFHIDYVFAHKDRLHNSRLNVSVGEPSEWLSLSDHMPMIVDL